MRSKRWLRQTPAPRSPNRWPARSTRCTDGARAWPRWRSCPAASRATRWRWWKRWPRWISRPIWRWRSTRRRRNWWPGTGSRCRSATPSDRCAFCARRRRRWCGTARSGARSCSGFRYERGPRLLGAIRVVRLVMQRVPVQNRYLRGYDAAAEWGGAHRVGATPPPGLLMPHVPPIPPPRRRSSCSGPMGTVVGEVLGTTAGPRASIGHAGRGQKGVRAFWAVLVLGWVMAGGIGLVRRQEHAARAGIPGAWRRWTLLAVGLAVLWAGLRYALLALDVPAAWAPTGAATPDWLSPARTRRAGWGGGIARSVADLALTAALVLIGSAAALRVALVYRRQPPAAAPEERWRVGLRGVFVGAGGIGLGCGLAALVRAAVFDATLPYFDPGGRMADPLILAVFASLLAAAAAVVLLAGAGWAAVAKGTRWEAALGVACGSGGRAGRAGSPWHPLPPRRAWASSGSACCRRRPCARRRGGPGSSRSAGSCWGVLLLSAVTYPALYRATEALERQRMEEGAEPFADGRDARVVFALEQVLRDARSDDALRAALAAGTSPAALDSLAADLVTGSLLAALDDYTVALMLRGGRWPRARRVQRGAPAWRASGHRKRDAVPRARTLPRRARAPPLGRAAHAAGGPRRTFSLCRHRPRRRRRGRVGGGARRAALAPLPRRHPVSPGPRADLARGRRRGRILLCGVRRRHPHALPGAGAERVPAGPRDPRARAR